MTVQIWQRHVSGLVVQKTKCEGIQEYLQRWAEITEIKTDKTGYCPPTPAVLQCGLSLRAVTSHMYFAK